MEEKKSTYSPKRALPQKKYLVTNFDDIKVRLPKGKREYYKAMAAKANLSLNSFAIKAMDELIEREGLDK